MKQPDCKLVIERDARDRFYRTFLMSGTEKMVLAEGRTEHGAASAAAKRLGRLNGDANQMVYRIGNISNYNIPGMWARERRR